MDYLNVVVSPRNEEEREILKRKRGLAAGSLIGTGIGQGLVMYANRQAKAKGAEPVSHFSHAALGLTALGAASGAVYDAYQNRKKVIKIREKKQETLYDEKPSSPFYLRGVPKFVFT